MRKLSDEEKAKLQTEIEKSQEKRKSYHIADQAKKEKSATIIVTATFTVLGGIGGLYLYVLYGPEDLYEGTELLVLLMCFPIGAAVGFIIGLLLSLLTVGYIRYRRRR